MSVRIYTWQMFNWNFKGFMELHKVLQENQKEK